jgi:hypothetical protein
MRFREAPFPYEIMLNVDITLATVPIPTKKKGTKRNELPEIGRKYKGALSKFTRDE